jgi:DNA adenine methylase
MSYPGSKGQAGVWQRIIGQMPPHNVYVEAFAGSAQIFRQKRRAAKSWLIDLDESVFDDIPKSDDVQLLPGCDALDRLTHLVGHSSFIPAGDKTLIYCDPPYPLSTRHGRHYYKHEMTDQEHTSLLTLLQALRCRVMISGVPCELYVRWLQNWRCISYRTRWHDKTVTECLWCNFPEPDELHDWRYAGVNHRQRVTLKRLAARQLARLARMAPRKRGYVLNAIREAYSS